MATEPTSTEALRQTLLHFLDDLAARGVGDDFNTGAPGVGVFNNPAQWKAAIERATLHELTLLQAALSAIESRILAREKREAQWKADDERRERLLQPLDPDSLEAQEVRARGDAARKAAEFRNSDSGRLERLVTLTERVVELLERQQAKV
jgi:hypothetical protein